RAIHADRQTAPRCNPSPVSPSCASHPFASFNESHVTPHSASRTNSPMSTLFAYHKTYRNGRFRQTYYFTKKKHPKIGDNIYVISGDSPRAPRYFLEGLYVVSGIG